MKIKKLYIFAELSKEPSRIRQVEISDDNQNIIFHFINSMEKGIRLSQDTKEYLEIKNESGTN